MRISIVVPAHNNADDLLLCLSALERATPADAEILGVDDASTDDTASRAAAHGIRVLRRSQNGGPSAARNDGALAAGGDIVLFVDADVVVAPDAVDRVRAAFTADPELAAVFGSYDARPRHPGVISRYRIWPGDSAAARCWLPWPAASSYSLGSGRGSSAWPPAPFSASSC